MNHDILRFANYLIWLQAELQIAITQICKPLGNIGYWLFNYKYQPVRILQNEFVIFCR